MTNQLYLVNQRDFIDANRYRIFLTKTLFNESTKGSDLSFDLFLKDQTDVYNKLVYTPLYTQICSFLC